MTPTEMALTEVLAGVMQVDDVPVDSHFFDDLGADSLVMAQFCARVRKRSDLPSVSMKDVYQHPTIRPGGLVAAPAAPNPCRGERSAGILAESCGSNVPVDSHFFDDLGADSLVMAQFCARVGKRPELPSVSMKDVYQHPTIKGLAAAFAELSLAPPRGLETLPRDTLARAHAPTGSDTTVSAPTEAARRPAPRVCPLRGAAAPDLPRLFATLSMAVVTRGYNWISGRHRRARHLPAVGHCSAARPSSACAPCRSWPSGCSSVGGSLSRSASGAWRYVRFWVVKTLIRANPLVLFVGSPLYVLYLRALGAKIGRGRRDLLPHVPVCTDLLTIGDGTVIRKEAFFSCYRAHAGRIQTGAVTLGQGRVRRRGDRARHRDLDGRRGAARPRLLSAHRAGGARRRALARISGAADRGRLPGGRPGGLRHPATGASTPSCSC